MNREAGEVVAGVGEQAEGASVGAEDVADEHETDALALRLGGEEGGEEVGRHFGRYARAVVDDGKFHGRLFPASGPSPASRPSPALP